MDTGQNYYIFAIESLVHIKNVFKCRPQEFLRNALSVCYVPVCGLWPVDIMHYYTDVCVRNDTAQCVDVESRNMFGRNDLNIF